MGYFFQLGFFYMLHPTDRMTHTTAFVTPFVEHWLEQEIAQWVHPMKDRSDNPSHHKQTLLPRSYISLREMRENKGEIGSGGPSVLNTITVYTWTYWSIYFSLDSHRLLKGMLTFYYKWHSCSGKFLCTQNKQSSLVQFLQ